MIIKQIFLMVFLPVCSNVAPAQTHGIVIDIETRVPLRDVRITTNNHQEVTTNWDGTFTIPAPFESASVSLYGYLTRNITSTDKNDTIELLPKFNSLSEVIVWGKRKRKFDSGITKTDAQLMKYQDGGFNLLGVIGLLLSPGKKKKEKKEKIEDLLRKY